MIWVNSASVITPSVTALREQQSEVEPNPATFSTFQIAPELPPSPRLKSRISLREAVCQEGGAGGRLSALSFTAEATWGF